METAIIKKVKNKPGYFAFCQFVGAVLTPMFIDTDYAGIVDFCKCEGYTMYYNLSEESAITI